MTKKMLILGGLILILLLTGGCELLNQQPVLSFYVVDAISISPLSDVIVAINEKILKTNQEGFTESIALEQGIWEVVFTQENYQEKTIELAVTSGGNIIYEAFLTPQEGSAFLAGYITDGKGGRGLANAMLTGDKIRQVSTDETGYFQTEIWANQVSTVLVAKEGRGVVKLQDIILKPTEEMSIAIPSPPLFNANYSVQPLEIEIEGITANQTISGGQSFTINVRGDNPLYALYGYYNGVNISPLSDLFLETTSDQGYFDSINYPNGQAYLTFHAYDLRGNLTIYELPVWIDNQISHNQKPDPLERLTVYAVTYGQNPQLTTNSNLEYFTLPDGKKVDLSVAGFAGAIYVKLEWLPVRYATGYTIYRSYDYQEFTKVADVVEEGFFDTCPKLTRGEEVFYQVVPYNSRGTGEPSSIIRTKPLAAYNVYLKKPYDQELGVSLTPTFKWEIDTAFDHQVSLFYHIHLYNVVDTQLWTVEIEDKTQLDYDDQLQPAQVYTWDIYRSQASQVFQDDEEGYAFAVSLAGLGDGSVNGEFIFVSAEKQ